MPSPPVVLALTKVETLIKALWGAFYGYAGGIVVATAAILAVGASPETGALFRLAGPIGMLVGAVAMKVRAPAMGVLADGDGVELHGFARTRRLPWDRIVAIGWSKPGRKLAVRLVNGSTRSGEVRLPRRVPADLVRLATANGVPIVADRNLRAAAHPLVDVRPPA